MAMKYIKWPQNIPNDHEIYQHFPFQLPPKYGQVGIFGMKMHIPSGNPGFMQLLQGSMGDRGFGLFISIFGAW
jgi:hypothetical protein